MHQVKKVMKKQTEEEVIEVVLECVKKHSMTIENLKDVMNHVICFMSRNAVLEVEDSENMNLPQQSN